MFRIARLDCYLTFHVSLLKTVRGIGKLAKSKWCTTDVERKWKVLKSVFLLRVRGVVVVMDKGHKTANDE